MWSFAVTLWEILTFAREQPYENMTDEKVIENCGHIYKDDNKYVSILNNKLILNKTLKKKKNFNDDFMKFILYCSTIMRIIANYPRE